MTDSTPRGFVAMQKAFGRALDARPEACVTREYLFAGRPVVIRAIGETLAQRTMAPFAHLEAKSPIEDAVPLRIDLWDESVADIALPENAIEPDAETTFTDEDQTLRSYSGGRFIEHDRPSSVGWHDRASQSIVYWTRDAERLSVEERSRPLQLLLQAWYYDQGVHVVHAGLVAKHGRGILIGGPTGSGKTSVSLACALGGFDFLSDDHMGLEPAPEGSFIGHSLYGCARVFSRHVEHFPQLKAASVQGQELPGAKGLMLLSELAPVKLASSTQVSAIVLPRIGVERVRLRPASRREVLLQLAPSSVKMWLGSGISGFDRLAQLIRLVPGYWLDLGPDVESIPGSIDRVLAEID